VDLRVKLEQLKKTLTEKENKDKALRKEIRAAIETAFSGKEIPPSFLRDFYLRHKKLTIVTSNKTFANELFFKKELILEKVREVEKTVEDILIK
jgi:hypothetical protein